MRYCGACQGVLGWEDIEVFTDLGDVYYLCCSCAGRLFLYLFDGRKEGEGVDKKNLHVRQISKCCGAPVKTNMVGDFIGDDTSKMRVGTCYYICAFCNQPCDVEEEKEN